MEKPSSGVSTPMPSGIALGDDAAVAHHDHRLGSAERRRRRLLEGVIERGLQSGIGRLDHAPDPQSPPAAAALFGVFSAAMSLWRK